MRSPDYIRPSGTTFDYMTRLTLQLLKVQTGMKARPLSCPSDCRVVGRALVVAKPSTLLSADASNHFIPQTALQHRAAHFKMKTQAQRD